MDPRIIKGVIVLLAIAAQFWAGTKLDADTIISLLSAFGMGAVVIRRPGDLEQISGSRDS